MYAPAFRQHSAADCNRILHSFIPVFHIFNLAPPALSIGAKSAIVSLITLRTAQSSAMGRSMGVARSVGYQPRCSRIIPATYLGEIGPLGAV